MFIYIGKTVYLCIWLFLLFNFIHPYPAPADMLAYIAFVTFFILHGLQAWLLNSTLSRQEKQQHHFRVVKLFIFGFIEAMSWKKNKHK